MKSRDPDRSRRRMDRLRSTRRCVIRRLDRARPTNVTERTEFEKEPAEALCRRQGAIARRPSGSSPGERRWWKNQVLHCCGGVASNTSLLRAKDGNANVADLSRGPEASDGMEDFGHW